MQCSKSRRLIRRLIRLSICSYGAHGHGDFGRPRCGMLLLLDALRLFVWQMQHGRNELTQIQRSMARANPDASSPDVRDMP